MGIGKSKIALYNIPLLMRGLKECQMPDDRDKVLDILEQVDRLLLDKRSFDSQCQLLKETDAMYLILRNLKKLPDGAIIPYESSSSLHFSSMPIVIMWF